MRQKRTDRVMQVFYEYPNRRFTVRDIARMAQVPRATAHREMLVLRKEKLITSDNIAESSLLFKTKKVNYYLEKIVFSGLIDEIIDKLNPSCIILFGSVRKGDSVKESDIDLFVESSMKKEIALKRFEKKIGHKIQLFIESDIKNLGSEMLNNIVNGIKIFGSFKIK